ncbi:cupin [Candidatus Saccharibacteria bacterium]|nr:cupin [Candidatus Saccharibacteria bacterium]
MQLRKYRWSRDYESAEEELAGLLVTKSIIATRWAATEYQEFSEHTHFYDKQLWCVEGSIQFMVGGRPFSIQPGDTLDIPAGTTHSARAGFAGCVCYETHSE